MISNSFNIKPKTSKSSSELEVTEASDSEYKVREENKSPCSDSAEDNTNYSTTSLSTIVTCESDKPDVRPKSRTRSKDDFQMARGGPAVRRSSNLRSRSTIPSKKMDRENDAFYTSRGKFQEPMNKGNASDGPFPAKSYNEGERNKNKFDVSYMVPEDCRISKLLRRLCREDDAEKSVALCKQLQESIMVPENSRYIRRSLDMIVESLLDMLHSSPTSASKHHASLCLGRVGYVLEQDFKRFMDWIFTKLSEERNENVRMLLMKALLETLRLESEEPKLKDYSAALMSELQSVLEHLHHHDMLICTVDVIVTLTEIYPETFNDHFRDTVDILVGWHIDSHQSQAIVRYASNSLLRFGRYWGEDMEFSVNLLSQFVEDMELLTDDLDAADQALNGDHPSTPEDGAVRLTLLIRVFSTVLRCIFPYLETTVLAPITWVNFVDYFVRILATVKNILQTFVLENLIVAANDCSRLLLFILQQRTTYNIDHLIIFVDYQLDLIQELTNETVVSVLQLICRMVYDVGAALPTEFIEKLLGPMSPILRLRFFEHSLLQQELIAVYHSLLSLKNIPLLQESYRYMLGDLEMAYKLVLPDVELCSNNPLNSLCYKMEQVETVVLFYCRAFADIANTNNSIISMWALKPSILELFASKLKPHSTELSNFSPAMQYSLLCLTYCHCSRYNHFVLSSELVNTQPGILGGSGPDVSSSPTSGHFTVVLKLLSDLLHHVTTLDVTCLTIKWIQEIFIHSLPYLRVLYQTKEYQTLLHGLLDAGYSCSVEMVLGILDNLEQLFRVKETSFQEKLCYGVVELCFVHLNSTNLEIKQKVLSLLMYVPWHITVSHLSKLCFKEFKKNPFHESTAYNREVIYAAKKYHLSHGICGEMQPQHFRKFMGYLLQGLHYSESNWIVDLFHSCWPLQLSQCSEEEELCVGLFGKLASASSSLLYFWSTWEAAQLCIMYKLRTPLGKPQETFTSIEGAIKSLAREITQSAGGQEDLSGHFKNLNISSEREESPPLNPSTTPEDHKGVCEQHRVRLLLEFVEQLEKVIHNAAEGCASAMVPPPKPVRTFFHTNKSTCLEWLTRIRIAVVVVAIHAGEAATAVRHGYCLLQDLSDSSNTQGPEFERAAMYVCWALCKLGEPEAILGMYAWCKEISGRKFPWLKVAAEQAMSRFETAAESYCKLLTSLSPLREHAVLNLTLEDVPSVVSKGNGKQETEPYVLGFMADQIVDCYKSVNNWVDLLEWKEKEKDFWANQNGGTVYKYILNSVSASQAKALVQFEEVDPVIMDSLSKWPSVEIPLISSSDNIIGGGSWSAYKLMSDVNNTVMNVAMSVSKDINPSKDKKFLYLNKIKECIFVTQHHIEEGLRNMPSEFLMEAIIINYAASGLQDVLLDKPYRPVFTFTENCSTLKFATSSMLCQVLWWAKYFRHTCPPEEHIATSSAVKNLQLEVARVARKEGNLGLAQRMLIDLLNQEGILFGSHNELEDVARVLSRTVEEIYLGVHKVRYVTEVAKLLYSMGKLESAVQLSTVTTLKLLSHIDSTEHPVKERCSRLLLTLAKWIQQDLHQSNRISEGARGPLDKLLTWKSGINILPDIKYDNGKNGTHTIPVGDMMVGQLLQCGVSSCPALGKSWNQLAAWCYRWGRRVVDAAVETGGQLSDSDKLAVRKLLPGLTSQESLEQIYSVLSKTKDIVDEEDIEAEDFNTSEMIESQLRNIDTLSTASKEELTKLVDIWRGAQKRVYSYYELSATAYFKYLEICGNTEGLVETGDCLTITATLRLLRLIVKHALELQSVLETGLTTTPTGPWKGIIPQLFSRLSHPEPYVRRRVSELLCRVAEDAPHLITFPAVVGAAAGGAQLRNMSLNTSTSRLFGACLSQQSSDAGELMDVVEEDDEEEENEEDEGCSDEENVQASVLKTCFRAMVDILSKQAPEAISQVQLLVKELRRITLLWDELWLGTLVQHHTEILRRMAQLEAEIAKVEDNISLSSTEKDFLIAEKHRIILKPLVFVLEQLHAITSVNPETPHEKWFQEKFGGSINEALEKLKFPTNPRRPHDSWQLLKQLQSRLQQRAQKRSAYSVRMSDVSPALAELKNTPIAMPGIASCGGKIITIASVENNIAILPTKTKPKKLVFHGSNGQMYTYLFKGLEDLHLDERIMQFLHIANTMMSRGNDRNALYRARHYSVIPLGSRSGLISWVDGVTPLFGLYKRWQQREATSALLKTQPHAQAFSGPGPVLRPSELFYNKLTPLLKERGISNLDNRKEWPLSVLRQVLTELMDETPKDLLAKELWCHSVSAGAWWHTVRTYSYSVAVMSIIGYIIGLGDRHLDNVLVDLATGEVVHIDYNVCFEKGKTLRVPEKVPFRMTPNIRAALGVTGVEGIFRHACEHVLKVMKKGRETLLTLLEAFVYDPLVDWTPGNETGYTGAVYGGGQAITTETKQSKKELEREVTQAMFCVRVAEMKSDWFDNRKELEAALPILVDHLNQWLDIYATIKGAKNSLEDCHHQMALVKEAEASPQHPLYTLFTRYAKFHCAKEALESAKARLKEKIEECKNELALHQLALVSIRGPQLSQWMNELNAPVDKDSHMVFDLVKEFLQNAGQAQMIIQCEQSENDLGQMAQQQNILIRSCLDLLGQYVAVASLYPASYMNGHRSMCYRRWSQELFDDFTIDNCQKVAMACKQTFGTEAPEGQRGHALAVSYQLQGVLTQVDTNIQKCFEKMTTESFHDGNEKCEEARLVIDKFLRSEKGAKLAFECVNITALCSLNQRYLKMEAAASSAGDCLVDLTSRDGGWFLDEMFLTSALVIELANLIPRIQDYETLEPHSIENNKKVELVLSCLHSSHKIFKGLLELNFNFHTIILPEAIKNIAMEEPTVLGMMQELDDIISEAGCPLPELLPQLEMHLRFVIMEMESPQKSCCETVARLRSQFNTLLQKSSGSTIEDTLTPGQMLLMGFNGLFEKLHLDGNALVTALETLDTPVCWKQVDQVREAKSYSAPVFKDSTRAVLEDIALVKRLITIQEFFLLCGQTARGLAIFSDDHLNRPVRRFTADYVSRQLLGVISQTLALALCLLLERIGLNVTVEVEQHEVGLESKVPLKDLCHKAVDRCMKNGLFSTSTLAQASSFCHKLEMAYRRREMSTHLQQEIEIHRSSLQRLQLQLTAHHWLHEDILISQATPVASLSRPNFLIELRKTSVALLSMQQRIVEMRDQQSALVNSVEQRLKWAAGANPALGEIMTAFETAVENRKRQLDVEQRLATVVANTCNALLHHEALRTNTAEALAYDAVFLEIIGQCEKSCRLAFGCDKLVNPEEESLVQMLMPHGPVDSNWISSVETLISDKIKSLQQQMEKQQESLLVAQDNIKSQTIMIRGLLSTHYKLAADVRTLLKSMAKSEESGLKDLQEYLASYKVYSEKFSTLVRDLLSDDLDSEKLNKCLENIVELGSSTKMIYEDILEFAKQDAEGDYSTSHEDSSGPFKRPPLMRQDSVCFSPKKGLPVPASVQKTSRDPHTGKAVQERNAYALGVWRRVRMKLEGRDPDPGRRLTVQEQVDHVIREAMSLDNLALLYEGWTPWV